MLAASHKRHCTSYASAMAVISSRPPAAHAFRDRQRGRNVIAGVRRFFREIRVVEIEIADAAAVRECRPVRWRLVIGAKDCRSVFRREICGYFSRDHKRFFFPCAERAAQVNRSRAVSLRAPLPSKDPQIAARTRNQQVDEQALCSCKKSRFQSADDFHWSKGSAGACAL